MGRTIITHLIDGSPKGAQYASINNRTCKMLLIPRANLSIINQREELQNPALYILLGEGDELQAQAYIGETESFRERVKDHHAKKAFWQKALVFISKDGAMTKADVQYLEHLAIKTADEAKRFALDENKQTPKAPNLPEHQKDTMVDFFEDVKFLTSFMGINIFDIAREKDKHLFYVSNRESESKGFYDENGFTVLKGSVIAKSVTPSFAWKEMREQFIKDHTTTKEDKIILETDQTFSSPSSASSFCIGTSTNGWTSWVDNKGQTLDEIYRKN